MVEHFAMPESEVHAWSKFEMVAQSEGHIYLI